MIDLPAVFADQVVVVLILAAGAEGLRQARLATASRAGKEVTYRLADEHVAHVIADALEHAREPDGAEVAPDLPL